MRRAGEIVNTFIVELARRNPNRTATIEYLRLRAAELHARQAFHLDPTPENLTAWCDANDKMGES